MVVRTLVKRNSYFDSVRLMAVSSALGGLTGVEFVAVVMATALNLEQLGEHDLALTDAGPLGSNDLLIVVRTADEQVADAALAEAEARLTRRPNSAPENGPVQRPRSLSAAFRADPRTNLVIVSVPGPFASIEAEEALRAGRHVLLFSDNVSLNEEVRLKQLAGDLGLLMMGPDCGTAIVGGVGLGFANAVRPGPIGLASASGTGLQQVACLIDWLGSGVSQAIGTGGRDLRPEVGGLTMLAAVAALGADEATDVIVLISKPAAPEVARRVLRAAAATGKPVIVAFLGANPANYLESGVQVVTTLTEAAQQAVLAAGGELNGRSAAAEPTEPELHRLRALLGGRQRFVRGAYSGGTHCYEALVLLKAQLGPLYSNIPLDSRFALANPNLSQEHTLVDLGADEFTVGRPHPMIDPTLRNARLLQEAADPATACLLLDVVLGYGAHPDPAGALVATLAEIEQLARSAGRTVPVLVSLCGTEADPQRLSEQDRALRAAGALIFVSNAAAAEAAAAIVVGR
jgi:FdrA protein